MTYEAATSYPTVTTPPYVVTNVTYDGSGATPSLVLTLSGFGAGQRPDGQRGVRDCNQRLLAGAEHGRRVVLRGAVGRRGHRPGAGLQPVPADRLPARVHRHAR